ncbi:hypothetical protein RV11_GL003520 [Enterococcus phoeniculicola]|nr:hypothetical protein RV11_GL003520 [Enterococcus phoeniculicola]
MFCSLLLVGCSTSEKDNSKPNNSNTSSEISYSLDPNLNTDSGIYDYVIGDPDGLESIEIRTPDGNIYKGDIRKDIYQVGVPSLGIDQNVKINYSFKNQTDSMEVLIPAKKTIDDYSHFSKMMNAVIENVNPDAKTRFPISVEEGASTISIENGVTTNINVYDGNLIGLELNMKQDVNKEMASILATFQGVYDLKNEGIATAYNNTLESHEKTSFTSKDLVFTFEYLDDQIIASIIRK